MDPVLFKLLEGGYWMKVSKMRKILLACILGALTQALPLSAIAVPASSVKIPEAKKSLEEGECAGMIKALHTALISYKTRGGLYPTTKQGLGALVVKPLEGPQPKRFKSLVKPDALIDPYGNLFRYCLPGTINPKSFDLFSVGKDGKEGTADDIGNW